MNAYIWLITSLLSTALAQLCFKTFFRQETRRTRPIRLAIAIALFVFATWATYQALRGLSLSTVYIATAVTQTLVVLLSLMLLNERFSARQYAGFSLILIGVVLFNL